jgi:hypothetical protein
MKIKKRMKIKIIYQNYFFIKNIIFNFVAK